MENKIVGKDMICPVTNQHCDDECCMPGSKCNLSGNSITPGFRMYYFTESKWYGPLPFIKLPIEEILNSPSGDSLIPEFAGMVKEENKDFVWRWFCKTCTSSIDGTRNCSNPKECGPVEKTAVPVAEEGKQTFSEEQSELEYLRRWKKEAMYVMPDFQAIGKEIGAGLGESVHDKILPFIIKLKKENEKLKTEYLKTIKT